MATKKMEAAIWARVSTHDQRETSLPSQVDRCRAKAEEAGYTAIHVFAVDWSSLDLYACPEFQRLEKLIRGKQIGALAVLDRDRLEAKGLQRLVFLSECFESDVELIFCQGPPLFNGPEGGLMEHVFAIGKERSVLRSKQGSKDGLHDRALKYRKPTSRHKLYGYRWDGERHLVPDGDWQHLRLIFDLALNGLGYTPIMRELASRAVWSPSGQPVWTKAALSAIFHNPTYAGFYFALKKEAVAPKTRRGTTSGNTSQRKLPPEEWTYIPEIEVVNPPINWDEHLQILDQLVKHQKLSKRNAKLDYLLRGLILCGTHVGKQGRPRVYHGRPHGDSYCYCCPVGGCEFPFFWGPELEDLIKKWMGRAIMGTADDLSRLLSDTNHKEKVTEDCQRELDSLDLKYRQSLNREARLEDQHLQGDIIEEVYKSLKIRYATERQWIAERKAAVNAQLDQLDREDQTLANFQELREEYEAKLAGGLDSLSQDEWRELLLKLNLVIHVHKSANLWECWPERRDALLPMEKSARTFLQKIWCEIDFPVKDSALDIALPLPKAV